MSKRTMIVHVALEFMDLGSLADLKKRLGGYGVEPVYLSNITAQIMNGLDYLHKQLGLQWDIAEPWKAHFKRDKYKLSQTQEHIRTKDPYTPYPTMSHLTPAVVKKMLLPGRKKMLHRDIKPEPLGTHRTRVGYL